MTTDEDLVKACARGDSAAFDALFERYQQPLWGYFRRRLADAARAEELTQDAFLVLLRSAATFEGRSSFRTWVYGIAANLLAADRRRSPDVAFAAPATSTPGTDDVLWIRQAIGRLDPIDREVVLLREFEDLSYAEIAGLLRIPVNTVRSRLARARLALRQTLLADTSSARRSS